MLTPNVRHANGATALVFATMFNRTEIVELLLAGGADPTIRDGQGLTAADHAAQQGFAELAQRLQATK